MNQPSWVDCKRCELQKYRSETKPYPVIGLYCKVFKHIVWKETRPDFFVASFTVNDKKCKNECPKWPKAEGK